MNEYQKALEDFRNHYKKIYEVSLDDEVLYFFIRVNELQFSIRNELTGTQEVLQKELSDLKELFRKEYASVQANFTNEIASVRQSFTDEMKAIPRNTFPKGKDAFLYGLGKSLYPTIIGLLMALSGIFILFGKDNLQQNEKVVFKNGKPALKIQDGNHIYFLPLNQR